MALDERTGTLYIADSTRETIWRVPITGGLVHAQQPAGGDAQEPVQAGLAEIFPRSSARLVMLQPSNRHTFGAKFGLDMVDRSRRDHCRQLVGDMVVSYLTSSA